MRRLNANDVDAQREVQIYFHNNGGPYVRGTVIAYSDGPTVGVRQDDGTLTWVSCSLPWEEVSPWRPGDIIRDADGNLWWRAWNNGDWVHLLKTPGNNHPGAEPMEPFALLLRDQREPKHLGSWHAPMEPAR